MIDTVHKNLTLLHVNWFLMLFNPILEERGTRPPHFLDSPHLRLDRLCRLMFPDGPVVVRPLSAVGAAMDVVVTLRLYHSSPAVEVRVVILVPAVSVLVATASISEGIAVI